MSKFTLMIQNRQEDYKQMSKVRVQDMYMLLTKIKVGYTELLSG
jgi:hypothetical protein